jgi:hypothetical protein
MHLHGTSSCYVVGHCTEGHAREEEFPVPDPRSSLVGHEESVSNQSTKDSERVRPAGPKGNDWI